MSKKPVWKLYALPALAALLFIVAYNHIILHLVDAGWSRTDFDYCYLIPIVVLYLIWEKWPTFASRASRPSWVGLLPVLAGVFFYLLGELGGEYLSLYLSMWFMLLGLCWTYLGWHKLKEILFPLCLILTSFPPPSFFYSKITLHMQLVSTKLGVWFLHLMDVSAFREGNVIDLGFTQLQIVQACSGLRFLIPLGILSLILVYYYKERWWKRGLILVLIFPLAILMNGLRLAALSIVTLWLRDPAVAESWIHDFMGWIMFALSLGVLLCLMWVLKRLPPRSSKEDYASGGSDTSGPRAQAPSRVAWPMIGALILMLGTHAFVQYRAATPEVVPQARDFAQFPEQLGSWHAQRYELSQRMLERLDLTDYYQATYENAHGDKVDFYVAWYDSQSKGKSIHSPETCLRGGGWQFSTSGETRLEVPGYSKSPVRVNRAVLSKPDARMLSYFWFACRGRNLINGYELKLYNFWDSLTKRRTDGALIRVMIRYDQAQDQQQAKERLRSFLAQALPVLDTYLPYR